eukprot:m.13540 g.13540  ORF g.13540 m.13540 type:complete len:61 (-) comp7535_c0_seq1:455-637(-)
METPALRPTLLLHYQLYQTQPTPVLFDNTTTSLLFEESDYNAKQPTVVKGNFTFNTRTPT